MSGGTANAERSCVAGCRDDAAVSNPMPASVESGIDGRDDALTRVSSRLPARYAVADLPAGCREDAAASNLVLTRTDGRDDALPRVPCWSQREYVPSGLTSDDPVSVDRHCVRRVPFSYAVADLPAGCREDAAASNLVSGKSGIDGRDDGKSGIDGRDDALTRVSSGLPARYAVADLPAGCREDAAASNLVLTRTDGRDNAWPRVLCWSQREYVPSGLTSDDSVSVYRH